MLFQYWPKKSKKLTPFVGKERRVLGLEFQDNPPEVISISKHVSLRV